MIALPRAMVADVAAEEQFGPYLVYERLGVGGMATVHRALERGIEGFERMVALKRLLPHLAEDASFIKSFVREAKLASLLNHVNIVQIFELGRVGTEYFISMEYIDGKDIRRLLRHARKVTGPPPLHVTVGILLQLCDALDYAHTKSDDEGHPLGLVHRDVSPSNLLITTAGHLKVIDFGIAKAQSSQLRTQTGRVKGKLAYMAPEAVAGKDLDSRSDVFAAGVIAHELLTARPLFASKNEYQTLLKVQRGDIMPPSTFNQACVAELDAIVLKALARDPDERYPGASVMRDELGELKRRLGLQTGYRDIASWIEWAFSVEAPSGGFAVNNTIDQTNSAFRATATRTPTPTPRPRREDEEAVEIAWGGGEADNAGPVVLDDIPDVSEKHLGVAPSVDVLGLDDIPTPSPSHGARSRELAARREAEADDGERRSGQFERKPASVPPGTILSPPAAERKSAPSIPPLDRKPPSIPPLDRKTPPSIPPLDRKTAPSIPPPARKTPPSLPRAASVPPPERERRITAQGAGVVPDDDDAIADPTSKTYAVPPGAGDTEDDDDIDVDVDTPHPPHELAHPADTVPNLAQVPRDAVPSLADVHVRTDGSRIPRTKPGLSPARPVRRVAGVTTPALDDDSAAAASVPTIRRQRPSNVTIGQAMVERELRPRSGWVVLLVIVLGGAAATGITLYATRGQDTVTAVKEAPRTPTGKIGTLKFVTEPGDAEIKIEGQEAHVGSPWSTPLDAGIHQIEIHRDGFKAWLTSIELSSNETQTLRVVLEPLGNGGNVATADATLILSPSPSGLDVMLDGQLLAVRTPIRMPIKTGPHTISLRRNGVELWRQAVTATASVDYAYSPALDKPREVPETPPVPPAPAHLPQHAQTAPVDAEAVEPEHVEPPPTPPPAPIVPPVVRRVPVDAAAPAIVAPTLPPPVKPLPTPPPTEHVGPALVAPSAVTKLSGETPKLGVAKNVDMPSVVAAKVCIDPSGQVSSAELLTKLERHAVSDLVDAIRTWRYAPYKASGTPVAACFVVTLRVK